MDLSALTIKDAGAQMELRHPVTGEALKDQKGPLTISLASIESQKFRSAQNAILNRRLRRGKKARMTAEELESEAIEALASATLGWSDNIELGGPLPYSHENAVRLYTEVPWIREQVDEFIADRENFLKSSAKS